MSVGMSFGIDKLIRDTQLLAQLKEKRIGLVGHPASTTLGLTHSLDAIIDKGVNLTAAFGPQHGMRGDKQDNMIESDDYMDERHQIPVYSLYGKHRRPTAAMLSDLDLILLDLQDLGCRIYTYLTTLAYFIDACAQEQKALWILDRPNPAGRAIDGLKLLEGEQSFVGCDTIPMRHGLTLGEFALWYRHKHQLDLDLKVIEMDNYDPDKAPGFGWPVLERAWINPSPNAASLNMARCYPGTVLLEGTELSEGRGTTTPLEVLGAPDLDVEQILKLMHKMAPEWVKHAYMRPCFFEPVFHKHQGKLCQGIQFHTDHPNYEPDQFSAFRLATLFLKSLRIMDRDYPIWRSHDYEYEIGRRPIDVISGGPTLREWVDDQQATVSDLEALLHKDAEGWLEESTQFQLYNTH